MPIKPIAVLKKQASQVLSLTFFFATAIIFFSLTTFGQHTLKIKVIDAGSSEVLPGANVQVTSTTIGGSTNAIGIVTLENLGSGTTPLKISFIGYQDALVVVDIPYEKDLLIVNLTSGSDELEDVIVTSTRTNSRIEDLPLKVEVLGLEEMDEESSLVPGNISSILGDLAVITIQRTNPVNGNDAIRMQGLDPQYTLLAKDGLPLYGGFSGSLGVLSIPPLDLKQVEIIKGSVSTLYGGGAISGMINFISREPTLKHKQTLLLNVTTLKEKNINTFFSGKIRPKIGYTVFAGATLKPAVDVNKDGFSEIPDNKNYIFHPRFFLTLNKTSKLTVGLNSTIDNRKSGDLLAVQDNPSAQHPYLRKENSFRNVLDIQYTNDFSKANTFTVKTALSSFQRELNYPYRGVDFHLKAIEYSSYTEFSDRAQFKKHTLVTGVNLITESFRNQSNEGWPLSNYDYITVGFFAQDDWSLSDKFTIETGLRYDHHNVNGSFVLPRIAFFYKASKSLSVRLASGIGYKTPNILAITDPNPYLINNGATTKSEYSSGINADINYKTLLWNTVEISFNQAFYFANIKNPIRVITDTLTNVTALTTQAFTINTLGADTYIQLNYKDFQLYLGYNHTEALQTYSSTNVSMPFNPKDKFSTTFAYSVENKWRFGIEASFTANQFATDNTAYYNSQTINTTQRVSNFWFLASMIEKKFQFFSLVVNIENITDSRQAKFEKLVTGSIISPSFKPIWGPLDGRAVNLSVKVNL